MPTTQTIPIDLNTRGANPVAFTHQGDTARSFVFEVYNNGEAFSLTGYTAKIAAMLPADNGYQVIAGENMATGTISDNTITATLPAEFSAKPGNGVLTIILTGSGTSIRPINVDFRIQKSADAPETIAGASDFVPVLQRYMAEDMQTYINAWLDAHPEAMQYYISGSKLVLDENGILSIQNDTDEIVEALDLDTLRAEVTDLKSDISDIGQAGKNLFNKRRIDYLDAHISATNIAASTTSKTIYVPCEPSTTYTISKQVSKRFVVAYTSDVPVIGSSVSGVKTYNNNSAITITTDATAKYLVAFIYLSTADTLTFEQICDTLQIEVGSSATAYEPYKLNAVDGVARQNLEDFKEYPVIQSENTSASFGSELINNFSGLTAIGSASYSNGEWTIPPSSGVSTSINVTAWRMYLIDISLVSSTDTDDSSMYKVNPLTVTLGNVSTDIFANTDGNWKVGLIPNATGSATLSLETSEALQIVINGLSVKQVTSFANKTMLINNNPVYFSEYGTGFNLGVGKGLTINVTGNSNTVFGYNAQASIVTGSRNTAFGAFAQNKTKTGCANVGIGDNVQVDMESGMFNNAIGTAAQRKLTIGAWNNAIGNEAQRDITTGCNNTGIGRRAQSYITTGGMNTAIGSMAGFAREDHQTGDWATKTSSFQTLVGGESTQATTGEANYLTTLGFRAKGNEKAIAIGANSSATGEKSIAIGYGVTASEDNQIVIGENGDSIILCGKRIKFNSDHTVTWEDVT